MVEGPGWAPLLSVADLVLLDQRGTGRSEPALLFTPESTTPAGVFLDDAAMLEVTLAAAEEAARHFRERGIDLAGYTTVESAQDVDDLRAALGLEKVSLMGHSYGTHLALEVVRRSGAHVERVVLAGTAGMDDMHKLPAELDAHWRMLGALVAADETLGQEIPDLEALLRRTLAKLAQEPLEVEVIDPVSRERVPVLFGPAGLQLLVLRDMGDTADIPVLPRLIHEIERGETRTLRWFVQKRYDQMRSMNAMALVMRGASGATEERWALVEAQAKESLFGKLRVWPPREVNAVLGTPDLGDGFRSPVRSDVPALFLSGTLDGNTPPEQAERVRAGFSRATHVIVENAGHEDLFGNPEVQHLIVRFLAGEQLEDARLRVTPLRFVPLGEERPEVTHPSLASGR
jgi:pimeloyl-ACP methyl ester carboxylesterase